MNGPTTVLVSRLRNGGQTDLADMAQAGVDALAEIRASALFAVANGADFNLSECAELCDRALAHADDDATRNLLIRAHHAQQPRRFGL